MMVCVTYMFCSKCEEAWRRSLFYVVQLLVGYLMAEVSNKCIHWSPALPLYRSLAFTLCRNVSLNKLSHARRLSSQDVILCREDVWNASHRHIAPSPIPSPTHTVFYYVPLSSSVRVQSGIAELCRAYFSVSLSLFFYVRAYRHTLQQCGVTRQHVSCSHTDFMEMLIYSMAIHTIMLASLCLPVCLSQWASSFLSPFNSFLDNPFCRSIPSPVLFCSPPALKEESTLPPHLLS